MKRSAGVAIIALFGTLLVFACAPKAAPAPTPRLAPTAAATAAPLTSNLSPPTSQDPAWDKVVAEARKEGKVTLYTWAFVGDIGQAVFKAFESQQGIKVEAITGVGTTLIERIKTEQAARKNIADTLDTSMTIVLSAKNSGITEKVADDLPVLRQTGVWRMAPKYDPDGQTLAVAQGFLTTFINTSRVKPGEEPKALKDLLDPRWKGGKIGLSSPVTAPAFIYIYNYRDKYGVDEDFFRQIVKQEPRIGPTVRESNAWVAQGETSMLVPTSDASMAPFIKEGAPLKAIELEGGPITFPVPGIALVKNAPHPNATRVFLNWLLSPEGQTAYLKARVSTPVRSDVPDFGEDVFRFKPRKTIIETYPESLKVARYQTELVLARLMGLGK